MSWYYAHTRDGQTVASFWFIKEAASYWADHEFVDIYDGNGERILDSELHDVLMW